MKTVTAVFGAHWMSTVLRTVEEGRCEAKETTEGSEVCRTEGREEAEGKKTGWTLGVTRTCHPALSLKTGR